MKINAKKLKDAEIEIVEETNLVLNIPIKLDSIDGLTFNNLPPEDYRLIMKDEMQEPLNNSTFTIYRQGALMLNSGTPQDVQNYLKSEGFCDEN